MPIFDFKCPKCEHVEKDVLLKNWDSVQACVKCEPIVLMQKIPARFFADVFPSEGIHLEHVSSEGKTFYSKKEMRQYAKDHDLELGAL